MWGAKVKNNSIESNNDVDICIVDYLFDIKRQQTKKNRKRQSDNNKLMIVRMYFFQNLNYIEISENLKITLSISFRIVNDYKNSNHTSSVWLKKKKVYTRFKQISSKTSNQIRQDY